MSLLNSLNDEKAWEEFYSYKTEKDLITKREAKALEEFIKNEKYKAIAQSIIEDTYVLTPPEKHLINKGSTGKKRVVYTFDDAFSLILKMLTYLMYKYDCVMPRNLYSFRKNFGAKRAVREILSVKNIHELHSYKIDISNYFNSIDINLLLPILKNVLEDDPKLYRFFCSMLTDERCCCNGKVTTEKKGAMAGTATSVFFANIYLREMDEFFDKEKILYARYSDDIIIFGNTDEIEFGKKQIDYFIDKYRLSINESKIVCSKPNEAWTFLGFKYNNGTIDISANTAKKLKDKIRRQARALYRWKIRKKASDERALRAMNIKFNRKFYAAESGRELCWARWFFPVINTSVSLKELDSYMQQWQRYIVSGRHSARNYSEAPYTLLKSCGYKSLVNSFYDYKSGGEFLKK